MSDVDTSGAHLESNSHAFLSILHRPCPNEDPIDSYLALYQFGSESFYGMVMTKKVVEKGHDDRDPALIMSLGNPRMAEFLQAPGVKVTVRLTPEYAQLSAFPRIIQPSSPTPLSETPKTPTWGDVLGALLFLPLTRGVAFEVEAVEHDILFESMGLDGSLVAVTYRSMTESSMTDPTTAASRFWTENHRSVVAQRKAEKVSFAESSRLTRKILALSAGLAPYVSDPNEPSEHVKVEPEVVREDAPDWDSFCIQDPMLQIKIDAEICSANLGPVIAWDLYEQKGIPQTDLFPTLTKNELVVVGIDNVNEALWQLRFSACSWKALAVFILARVTPFEDDDHEDLRANVASVPNLRLVILSHSARERLVDAQTWDKLADVVFIVKDINNANHRALKNMISKMKAL